MSTTQGYLRLPSCLLAMLAFAFFLGCSTTPEDKAAKEQLRRDREAARLAEETNRKTREWQAKLAPFTTEQLHFKLGALTAEAAKDYFGIGIGYLIAKGHHDSIVKERDAVAMEIIRRGGSIEAGDSESQEPPAGTSVGSGFAIASNGYFLTCFHVIEGASNVAVIHNGKRYEATIISKDPVNDVALLKVDGNFAALPLGPSADVRVGHQVFTLGYPHVDLQGVEPKLTVGHVSSLSGFRDDPRHFQVSVPIQPGNSGGPLVNPTGEVVGMMDAKLNDLATLRETGSLPQNVNYALKSVLFHAMLQTVPDLVMAESPHESRTQVSIEESAQRVRASIALVVASTPRR